MVSRGWPRDWSPDDSDSDAGDDAGRCDVRSNRPSRVNWIDFPWPGKEETRVKWVEM